MKEPEMKQTKMSMLKKRITLLNKTVVRNGNSPAIAKELAMLRAEVDQRRKEGRP